MSDRFNSQHWTRIIIQFCSPPTAIKSTFKVSLDPIYICRDRKGKKESKVRDTERTRDKDRERKKRVMREKMRHTERERVKRHFPPEIRNIAIF